MHFVYADESTSDTQAAPVSDASKSPEVTPTTHTTETATPTVLTTEAATPPSTTKTSTLGGGPVASPSDIPEGAAGLTLSASSDVIPKPSSSPVLGSKNSGLMSLLKENAPFEIFGGEKGESSSETTTGTTTSSSNSHSTSENEDYEEDEVGESKV